ncbi:MAG TPA: phosphatase PAP2 family protein [Candidatus Nanopelagicales bacterium]
MAAPAVGRRWRNAGKALVAASVLGVSTYLATAGVPDWEAELFSWLHDAPRAVDSLLWLPMQAGSAWAPPLAALIGWRLTRSWRPTLGSLVAGWGGWWLAKAVKAQIGRGRPSAELPDELVRSSALTEGLGFVSGHSTVAFACASILAPYLSRTWRVFGYGLASTVGLSRVVVGAHLPLDVVGGAALGLMLAYGWHAAVGVDTAARPAS